VAEVVDATDPGDVLRHDIFDLRPRPARFVRGRLLLLGDAAHAMTPDLGQGACQAFEDAVVLGEELTGATDAAAALARYSARRAPRVAALQQAARRANRMLTLHGPRAAVRDALLRGVPTALATRALVTQLHFDPAPAGARLPSGG
jgi:2-polyprenyl-6-methoxyphenol hydroxylase-like FAD-dependent oxidoreductase